jgi:hypothetical protein
MAGRGVSACHAGAMNEQDNPPQQDDDLDDVESIEGEPPPVDEYRLSTHPRSVGGGS